MEHSYDLRNEIADGVEQDPDPKHKKGDIELQNMAWDGVLTSLALRWIWDSPLFRLLR